MFVRTACMGTGSGGGPCGLYAERDDGKGNQFIRCVKQQRCEMRGTLGAR